MERTSATLLEALQQNNKPEAWNRFVTTYTPILYKWSKHIYIPQEHREDLIQEVFLLVHRKIQVFQYDPGKSFRGWLKRLLKNLYIDFIRKKQIKTANSYNLNDFSDPLHEEFWDGGYQSELLLQGLKAIRSDFNERTFNAFELSTLRGLSIEETAAQLGMTIAMVYQSRSRVLTRLREFINGLWE